MSRCEKKGVTHVPTSKTSDIMLAVVEKKQVQESKPSLQVVRFSLCLDGRQICRGESELRLVADKKSLCAEYVNKFLRDLNLEKL